MKKETIEFLIAQARAGKLGAVQRTRIDVGSMYACVYKSGKKCCGIGALLPPDMVDDLDASQLVSTVKNLSDEKPAVAAHLLSVWGLTLGEAQTIQAIHDGNVDRTTGEFHAAHFVEQLQKIWDVSK